MGYLPGCCERTVIVERIRLCENRPPLQCDVAPLDAAIIRVPSVSSCIETAIGKS